jgi:hypothetical protein
MGKKRNTYTVVGGKPKEYHLEDLGIDRRIILKLILKEQNECRAASSGSG